MVLTIAKTIQLAGQPCPLYKEDRVSFQLRTQQLLEGFCCQDPPVVPQLAIPITVPNLCFSTAQKSSNAKLQATGELALIAFYYLLCVSEYTKPWYITRNVKKVKVSCMVQFTLGNIDFFKDGKLVSHTSPLSTLKACHSAILKITNQKNGHMGETIHQEAVPHILEKPIMALANRVHHILQHGGSDNSLLCNYFDGS